MNKEFLKYNTKMMFFFTLAFIGLMFAITLFVGIVTKDINYSFWAANYELRNYFILMIMLFTGICFRESVTKEYRDVIYSLPINKKQYFDVLFIKTLIITAIPFTYYIVIELIGYVINVPVANFQSGIYIFIAFLIPTFLLITVMIFIISISASVVPMLTTLFWAFLTYTYTSLGLNLNNLAPKTLGIMIVLSMALLIISRKLFELRNAERMGKLFMFRWAEILFASIASSLIGFTITGIIGNMFFMKIFMSKDTNGFVYVLDSSYNLGVLGNVISVILMILSYIVIDSLFVKSFSKENIHRNIKYLIIPIVMYFGWLLLFAVSF